MKKTDDNKLHEGFIESKGQNIPFIVEYSENRRKVCPEIRDGPILVVTAPMRAAEEEIYFVLNSRLEWIEKKYFLAKKTSPGEKSRHSVTYQDKTYDYILKYDRNTKNYKIKIYKDNNIEVIVPAATKEEDAESFVKKNVSVIHEKINEPGRKPAKKLEFKNGGHILIKGKVVRIETIRSQTSAEPKLKGGILTVTLPDNLENNEFKIEQEISALFQKITQNKIDIFVPKYAKLFGIRIPDTEICYYKKYWGKCMPSENRVIFNEYLAMLPNSLIEYIVAHELCHFYQPNHKQDFYSTLREVMPDADKRCKKIDCYGIGLIKDE